MDQSDEERLDRVLSKLRQPEPGDAEAAQRLEKDWPGIVKRAREAAEEKKRPRRFAVVLGKLSAAAALVAASLVGLQWVTWATPVPDFAQLTQPSVREEFKRAVGLDREQNERVDKIAATYTPLFTSATGAERLSLDSAMGKELEALLKAEQRDRYKEFVKQRIPQQQR